MRLYYPIEVDLFRPYPLPIMEAQQNNIGRGAQVTLKANGAIIQPTNEGLTFWAKKPDGTVSYLAATLSGTNVQLDFTNQMLAVPGMVQVEIRMTSGDGASMTDISTPIFSVRVNPSNISDGPVESSNEFTALLKSLGEIEELKKNGLKGDPGEAASITVGTVEQTPAGTVPTVRNSGTDSAAVLDFTFPEAETGFYDVTLTLSAGAWEGTAPPYSQTVSAKGMTAEKAATYAQVTSGTIPTEEERAEYAKLQGVLQGAGQVTFYCLEKPTIELTVRAYNGAGTEESGGGGALDLAVIAADFLETASYAVGDYCIYNQELKRFTEAKEAGGWNEGKAVTTTVTNELQLKGAEIDSVRQKVEAAESEIGDIKNNMSTYQLIWQNPNPDTAFGEQEIDLVTSPYKKISIDFRVSSVAMTTVEVISGMRALAIYDSVLTPVSGAAYIQRESRTVQNDGTSVTFYDGMKIDVDSGGKWATDDTVLIPQRIWGIK